MSTPLLDAAYSPPAWSYWLFGMAGVVGVLFLVVPWTTKQIKQSPGRARRGWDLLPFSQVLRYRRAWRDLSTADAMLRQRIQGEAAKEHFDASRAVQTIYEDVVDPRPWDRPIWIYEGMLGYGTSGNIALVKATTVDDPEVVDIMQRFNALKARAATWPETIHWTAIRDKVNSLERR